MPSNMLRTEENKNKLFALVVIPTMENAYHNLQDFVAIIPPMGLASIAASVESTGRSVVIIDGDAERLTFDQTMERLILLKPDYVGFTVMTATFDITSVFCILLKNNIPEVHIIVGGPHASALPEQTLADAKSVDVIVIGEGDIAVLEIIEALDDGRELNCIDGIAFRDFSGIHLTAPRGQIGDLDTLLRPALHLLKRELYRSYGWNNWVSGYRKPFGVVFTGRGCVGKCNFCAANSVFGHGVRYFSLEQVKSQIDYLVNDWQIRILYFLDDTFTANRKMVNDICDYLIENKYNHHLEIMVSSRVDTIHFPTLQKMRHAGVRWICFGVESGNQEILSRMNKNITIEQIHKAFGLARKADLFIAGNFMIGHIGETEKTAMDTVNLACDLDQDYASFAIAIPLPGTELFEYCLEIGTPLPPWNDFGSVNSPPIPINKDLDADTLIHFRDIAIRRFFKRPYYILGLIWRMRGLRVLRDFISMYLAIRMERAEKRF